MNLLLNSPLDQQKPSSKSTSPIGDGLLNVISKAEKTIDFAIYGLRDQPEILQALLAAKKRGVVLRGVVDMTLENENYYDDTEEMIKVLGVIKTDYETDKRTKEKVDKMPSYPPFWPPPEGFDGPPQCVGYSLPGNKAVLAVHASRKPLTFQGDIMHNKFVIADKRFVWTGSCNLSNTGTGGYNANVAVVTDSSDIARWFTTEFEQMYVDGLFHREKEENGKTVELKTVLEDGTVIQAAFSPQGYAMERLVRPLIQNAKESIDVAIFFLTHKRLAGDLIKAHHRGVKVRVILDATAAKNGYTKHEILRAAGIPLKVENWGGKMHMKAAAIDGQYLIVGSMNWTSAGERNNDENTLIIKNGNRAKDFSAFYGKLWESIPDRWLKGRPDPESGDSGSSWHDGIDNDFDDLVDLQDPGCRDNPPPLPGLPPFRIVPKSDGYDLIKGNINGQGKRYYFLPTDKYYSRTKIDTSKGEKWFPSIDEVKEAGWTRPRR